MTFENRGRYYVIEGRRYEWRWVDVICGLYEIEEPSEAEAEAFPVEGPPKQGDIRDTCSPYSVYLEEPSQWTE